MRAKLTDRLLLHYGSAVAAVSIALLLTLLIPTLKAHTPFIFFFSAVSLTAWLGGLGPALLAIALSLVSTHYFVLPPAPLLARTSIELLEFGAFVAVASLIGVLSSALREASARFHATLASIGDGVIASDTEGRITFMNPVAEALTGWSANEAVGKEISEIFQIINMDTREPIESPVAKVLRQGTVVGLANHTLLIAKDATERPIDDSGSPIRDHTGTLLGVVLVFRDLTGRRISERALQTATDEAERRASAAEAAEALLHTLLEHVPEGITIAAGPPDFPIRANSRFALELMGRPEQSVLGMPAAEHVYAFGVFRADGVTRPAAEDMPLYRASRRGESVTDEEWVMERPDGTRITVLQNVTPIRDAAGQILGAISCWRDITERKQAENDFRRAAALLDLTHESILVLDFSGTIIFWNRGAAEMYGWPPEEALGRVAYQLLQTRFPTAFEEIKAEILQSDRWEGDLAQTRRDGSSLVVSSRWALQRDTNGRPLAILEINFDITARIQMERQLRSSLAEKEVLLKEVHHRVKNNLQVISSLLSLQSETVQHAAVLDFVQESQRRIQAMSLVHETLYQGNDVAQFNMAAYVQSLSEQVLRSFGVEADRITLHTSHDEVILPLETAVPCGLIVSELLSNSLKHAFPGGQAGEITVTLSQEADRITLRVRDNGCGFPDYLDFRHTESLGLQLVCALAEQLDGTIALERTGGTSFTLTFPVPSE